MQVPKGFVIGAMENSKCGSAKTILKPGDTIFLYTDGVTEAMSPQSQLFSEERLKACLIKLKDRGITEIIQGTLEEIRTFAQGAPQSDDITMVALRFKGKGA
jgi:sigma-B regulation protein RsbU (phosphoserine phosphatase)